MEKYFRKGSSGTMSQERENKLILVWKYRKEKKRVAKYELPVFWVKSKNDR